ncbi:hypothetical protein SPRG_18760 [Saprolegnia parasitica CBS 223.65]|uniref:Uncharacterized protein n=1 Tax=Saprolegnia parasitica (strain CBS 223.65) TaxID=695850 RepID=A0A067BCA8_SAPPC|nr:hypothetical protein SPRG_18760 [Saprolegnia parasitica CBS 223.65]KDO15698.1 hypothetical protein SPRG_18760 [Saprolegnia parasitica CBS 223.65]|eukprot:XP_012213593.1 hypothetical protein SPRG_18760 [Saprolegnia parasitica CBS 223.65]
MMDNNVLAQIQVVVFGGACIVMLAAMCVGTRCFKVPARASTTNNDLSDSDETVVEAAILRGWRRLFHHLDLYCRRIYCTSFAIIFAAVASSSTISWVPYVSLGAHPVVVFHAWKVLTHALSRDAAQNDVEHWERVRNTIRVHNDPCPSG